MKLATLSAKGAEEGGVQARNVDVRTARLEQRAPPFGSDSRNDLLELRPLDDSGFDGRRKLGQVAAREVKVTAGAEESPLGQKIV